MSRNQPIILTKRDGTLERFSVEKLRNCVANVLARCAYDPQLAEPLARAVEAHLGEWQDERLPTTEYIHRCVRSVLQQTGLTDAADELAVCNRSRRAQRKRLRVLDPQRPDAAARHWRKAALVSTLEGRYGLSHTVARFLAGRIELQVFALDYCEITRAFLAELVRNELQAWGLSEAPTASVEAAAGAAPVAPRPEKE